MRIDSSQIHVRHHANTSQVKSSANALNPFPERQLAAASYLRKEGERINSYVLAQVRTFLFFSSQSAVKSKDTNEKMK